MYVYIYIYIHVCTKLSAVEFNKFSRLCNNNNGEQQTTACCHAYCANCDAAPSTAIKASLAAPGLRSSRNDDRVHAPSLRRQHSFYWEHSSAAAVATAEIHA